jgi:hypothetical protein
MSKEQNNSIKDDIGFYGGSDRSLTEIYKHFSLLHKKEINEKCKEQISLIKRLLNIEYEIASPYMRVFKMGLPAKGVYPLSFSCFHKNLFSIYAALDLTERGFHGPARPNMRHAYEALLITKYCSTAQNKSLFEKWMAGKPIHISREVFAEVVTPKTDTLREFWLLLCSYTHASKYAQQVHFAMYDEKPFYDVLLNFVFIRMLLECNYHILVSHLATSRIKYYVNYYGDSTLVSSAKRDIKKLFSKSRKEMLPLPKRTIADFKKKWILKA